MSGRKTGYYIKTRRTELGLTLDELSAELGAPRFLIEKWEAGSLPETQYLLPLSKSLQCEIEDILLGKEPVEERIEETVAEESTEIEVEEKESALDRKNVKKEQKSYYEELREKTGEPKDVDYAQLPRASNGFYPKERIFAYVLCVFFLLIFAVNCISAIKTKYGNGNTLTTENYLKYVSVNVYAAETFNSEEYVLQVQGRGKIVYDFKITVEIKCVVWGLYEGMEESYTITLTLSDGELERNEKITRKFPVKSVYYTARLSKVISVAGRA